MQRKDTEGMQVAEIRACHYALLSRLFSDQITSKDIEGFLSYLEPLADQDDSPAQVFVRQLHQWLKTEELDHLLKTEYARLFIMPGGVKPYESVYRGEASLLMQEPWVKVKQFYQRSGLKLENPAFHPEDHASAEFAFMLYLIEADSRNAEEEDFFRQHLGCWVPKMLDDLIEHQHAYYFKDVANFGREFLESERRYFHS